MKKEILKIIPDFDKYFLIDEWQEMTDSDVCYRLEHEIELYKDYEYEGFSSREQATSVITKENIRKVNGLLKRYYNNKI